MSTSSRLPGPRADALAARLDLDFDAGICLACLGFVAWALDNGDLVEIARETTRVTRDLWDEGLAEQAFAAVQDARDRGIPDADAAFADLERNAGTSSVARSIVRRLAEQLCEQVRIETHLRVAARDRLGLAPPELN